MLRLTMLIARAGIYAESSTPANALGAQNILRRLCVDPKFALSWALLSYADARGYLTLSLQPTVALREEHGRQPKPPSLFSPTLARP